MNKNKLIFQGLIVIFLILSVFISIFALDSISAIFISIAIFIIYFIYEFGKAYKMQEEKKQFIEFTQMYMKKHNIYGQLEKTKKIKADYVIFFPNKVLLVYPHTYQGTVKVNENIYDDKGNILKNITTIKNNALIDTQLLLNEYETFKANNFPYNPINIIPICYIHDASLQLNFQHNLFFANKKNIIQLLDHSVLDQSIHDVFPYDDFIIYLKQKSILSN